MIKEFKLPEDWAKVKKEENSATPKHIWRDVDRVIVYTGADIPPAPTEEPQQ